MGPIVKDYVEEDEMKRTKKRDLDGSQDWTIALYHHSCHALCMHL